MLQLQQNLAPKGITLLLEKVTVVISCIAFGAILFTVFSAAIMLLLLLKLFTHIHHIVRTYDS